MNPDLRLVSGTEIARRIRDGELTSREAVEAHIAQIERVNPVVNALVRARFAEARREADLADARLADAPDRAALGAFHGVPFTVKECFALTGMPQSAGIVARKDVVAHEDATVVARLRAAGAVALGVTNTSEACMWMESNNYVYGRTDNPYDRARIVGGSSGGEGAIIAAGASPFGVGSDVGGSIRGPCFFNGIFGHKPTGGLVPNTGQFPLAGPRARRILSTGPMCRRAEDLYPLLRLMASPDGVDVGCTGEYALGDPSTVDLATLRVVNVEDNGALRVSRDLCEAQARAAAHLASQGATVVTRSFAALRYQFEIWSAMLGAAQDESFGAILGQPNAAHSLRELARWAARRSDYTLMASLLALIDPLPGLVPQLQKRMAAMGRALREEIVSALGPHGVMLYPTYTEPAPPHFKAVRDALRLRFPFAYQGVMNVLELPATQVPLGLNAEGLPLGVQVISAHGRDHVTIAVARELERAFGGWVPPRLAGVSAANTHARGPVDNASAARVAELK